MVGGLLRLLSDSVREHILRSVRTKGYEDLRRAHLAVFQFPSPDGSAPSVLAERAHVTKQSMNYLLGELEERGYLGRQGAPADGRSRVVFLTPRGKRLVKEMRQSVKEVEDEWRSMLGAARFHQMKGAMMNLYKSIQTRKALR